jgi:hypothetical protein
MSDPYSICPHCGAPLVYNPWTERYESRQWQAHECKPAWLSLHIAPCGCVVKLRNGEYSTVKSCERHADA